MFELSIGIFLLLALVLAFRESAHPAFDHEEDDMFSLLTHKRSIQDQKVYEPDSILEEVFEEMISIQAETVEAVSALAASFNNPTTHDTENAVSSQ